MPTGPANTADDFTDTIRSLVDRLVDAKITQELTRRGQEVASELTDRGAEAWQDTRPLRRDAAKRLARASRDTARWSDRTWRSAVRPTLKDLWKRRSVAVGAAATAVPVGRELVDTTAVRLGLKEREERRWASFFFGMLLGIAAGAIAAMLLTPKRGSEMRRELTARADEIANRAKDEWVPIFQREEATNGRSLEAEATAASLTEGAADTVADVSSDVTMPVDTEPSDTTVASGEAADRAATETAEAINEAYDSAETAETVDRESPTA